MKKAKVKAFAGILALTLVVGSLAYFTKTMSIDNPFSTKKYGGETVEKFTPEKNWEPGAEVNKDVTVKNTGDYDVLVRVKLTEKWVNKTTDNIVAENTTGLKGNASQIDPADGLTTGDYSGASYDVKIEGELLQASLATEAANYMKWGMIPTVTGTTVTWN